ncbi:MAG TPA: DUF805 domain-containing protein [Stellaceae bacterium]|jgi:uncharacterized membrane protein YhaH (DUF805 family)
MNFFDAIKTCFTKYADFTGRAARPEYWWFFLFCIIVQLCLRVLWMPLEIVFGIAILLPALAVGARRLHDTDRSGWWLLIDFVPVVGWIVLLVWFCQKSEPVANRFGPPPLPQEAVAAA